MADKQGKKKREINSNNKEVVVATVVQSDIQKIVIVLYINREQNDIN
jgi:hypothetical protein